MTVTILGGVLLAPALIGVSQAAQSGRESGARPPLRDVEPARGVVAPPEVSPRVVPDMSRLAAPSVGAAARPALPSAPRPVPWVLSPSVAPTPVSRQGMEPVAPPAMGRGAREPRALREPSPTSAQSPAEVSPAGAPRTVREPGGTQPVLQPRVTNRAQRATGPQVLQSWLRTQNAGGGTLQPGRDTLGNQIPRDAVVVGPDRLRQTNRDFGAIREHFGDPQHRLAFLPRTGFDRDFFGIRDGRDGFHRFHHHPIVVVDFFYPFYFSDPFWFGFGYPGYYPSIYTFWGWTPAWVYPDRVVYAPPVEVYGTANPYYLYGGRSVDSMGAQVAIADIRQAWIGGDAQLIAQHLTDQQEVAVYFNGDYTYSTSSQDYYGMTVDAISTTQTVALDFDAPVWVSQNEVFYTGRHTFTDPDGNQRTVYVSYMLKRTAGSWYIESVGSSPQPIQSPYQDFRSY